MRIRTKGKLLHGFLFLLAACLPAAAQSQALLVTVHSPALEHNLLGDPADQKVGIYLPAAYAAEPQRRFAVVYFLHGFADTHAEKVVQIIQPMMDKLIADRAIEPMIVVAPNGLNKFFGSFYANSEVTGNWEDYIVRDVVGYVDAHYRTLASPESRGIAGHSMGGYGALMLGFKHPDVFSSLYALSPCCTVLEGDLGPSNPIWSRAQEQNASQPPGSPQRPFMASVVDAMDAAFAPDPNRPPSFGDSPFRLEGGLQVPDPAVMEKFRSHIPATAIPSLLPLIFRLKGIYIDYGAEDNFSHIPIGARTVSDELARAGVPHTIEVYEGNHGNRIHERMEIRLFPWFSRQLKH